MRVGVDSSVLIALLKGEEKHRPWLDFFLALRRRTRFFACDVVYAELAGIFPGEEALKAELDILGVAFDPVRPETAFLAGKIHQAYRKAGGPRSRLIPDFLIGAHALKQCEGLLTSDRGYFRNQFEGLKVYQPPEV
jgi:predicted nucleic acid-binding protein